MALARPLAGPDNAVPSLPDSDSWLSEETKKIRSLFLLFLHVLVQSSYILDVESQHFGCWARHQVEVTRL